MTISTILMAALAGHCTSQVIVPAPCKITRLFLVLWTRGFATCLRDSFDFVHVLTESARFEAPCVILG